MLRCNPWSRGGYDPVRAPVILRRHHHLEQIENALVWLLNHYHEWLNSWGLAIVLLTFTVRIAMLPLTISQFRSMAAMQVVQPKVKALQNKYKGKTSREDRQKMQAELMELYKEHNVNPFGSCLPLLIQMPVFIGLYRTLRNIHPTGDQGFLGIPTSSCR